MEDNEIVVENPVEVIEKAENKVRRVLKRKKGWWPEEKRIEVASLYAAGLTNSSELSKLTGVPSTAIRTWRGQDWWPELLEQVQSSVDTEVVSKFTKIVNNSLEVIQDRLINGDFIYDKRTGEVNRKPVSMRDTAAVTAMIVDKRQLLRGKATSRTEKVSTDDRLSKLAAEFKRFVQAKEINPVEKEINLDTQG